jgi:N-sulfoglucosamine sulfohydrolase
MPRSTLLLAALLPIVADPRVSSARNIVLVVVDDMGRDAGCYGHPVARTPHLDALAAEGTLFTHAFCTTASCSPSRSVILTGLHNHANGQYGLAHAAHNFHSRSGIQGLPGLLAAAGYRTARIGKFHVLPEETYHFETDLGPGPQGSRNAVGMAAAVRDFIRRADPRPFFLYFCPTDPHRSAAGFANEADYPGIEPIGYRPEDMAVPPFLPDQPESRAELAEYCQAVSRVDQGLGALVRVLKDAGRWDDTLVIFASDNGIPFPGAKTTLYEPGLRLPLVVRAPGQPQGGVTCQAMVSWADLTPTILDYAGAQGPSYPLHGRSFLPVLDQPSPDGWDEVYASHTFHEVTMYYPMRAVRTRRHKLIQNLAYRLEFPFASDLFESRTWQGVLNRGDEWLGNRPVEEYINRPRWELFDLDADPHELSNLAADPAYAEVFQELQARLRDFQERTADPWLIKYRHE